ncbi:MAG: hypothetical protein JST82_14635 [Bacteroidetes bacterium]|nr:hypothetical protein [Bacteroidota bacterium]
MKRLLVIPIMFLYIFAVSGVMVSAHYCGKQLESWKMYAQATGCKDDVCSDKPEMEEGCCKDKVVVAKVSTDQNIVNFFKLQLTADWILPVNPEYLTPEKVSFACVNRHNTYQPNAPPGRWQNIPLFKLHSSFTYYG